MKKRTKVLMLLTIAMLSTGCGKEEPKKSKQEEPVKKENIYSDIYINKINEISTTSLDSEELSYNLIYINNDTIPELVVAKNSYYITAYTIKDKELHQVFEELPYGAFGNSGYEYIEKQNVIRNYDSDHSGLLVYTTYYKMDDNMELSFYYDEILSEYYFNDYNNNNVPDEGEYDETSIKLHKCMYGKKQISVEEFDNYTISGNYTLIEGKKTKEEIINTLNALK